MKEKYAFQSITTWLCFAWFCKLLLLGWGKWMIITLFNLTFSFAFLPDFLQIFYCAGKSQNLKSCPIRWKRWKVRTLVQCSPRYLDEEELESEEELEDEDEAEEALFLVLGGILEVAMQPAVYLALSSTCWVSDLKRRLISLICGFRLNPLLQCFQWKFTLCCRAQLHRGLRLSTEPRFGLALARFHSFGLVVVVVTLGSQNSQKNLKYQKTTRHSQCCNEKTEEQTFALVSTSLVVVVTQSIQNSADERNSKKWTIVIVHCQYKISTTICRGGHFINLALIYHGTRSTNHMKIDLRCWIF